ncbi:hypothetical protein [Krasilnikovia sp. MM14-A1259]|uniref:hypothetical protein n=1 Tax=Krasilnikovia sp. MM14-A1259 TaxID=3373539 RepID=UPI0038049636
MTADDLSHLRVAILAGNPQAGDLVRRDLTDNGITPAARVDRHLLLTETHQRQGRIADARLALGEASAAADAFNLPAGDPCRTALFAIRADLAVWDGHVEAVQVCTRYAEQARDLAQDLLRLAHATALRSVAIYHRDSCAEARRLLGILHERAIAAAAPTEALTVLAPMIERGLSAMAEGCRPGAARPPGPVPPLPGGVLKPSVADPDPDYLASRVRQHPARHTCAAFSTPGR